jgi:aromatase
MHTQNSIWIDAAPEQVFRLAADIADWPRLLPHYRWVRSLRQSGNGRTAEMAARRAWIPVKWTARQQLFPADNRITYRHIAGVTKGMEVEWRLSTSDGGTLVEIAHDLTPCRWIVRTGLVGRVVTGFFIEGIAGRTLQHIKWAAEDGAADSDSTGET